MVIALDLDGVILAFPGFFKAFVNAMQEAGCTIGILTGRPDIEKEDLLKILDDFSIKPDFFITKPPELTAMPNGEFKARVCNESGIDYLFDDFQSDDPKMMADFFSLNEHTKVFTSFPYQP